MTCQLKWRRGASAGKGVPSWPDVWCLLLVVPPCLWGVAATNAVVSCWKKPSTLVCITSGAHLVVFQYCSSFLCFVILDHFENDPVATPIHASRHQLVTLCRSVCAQERVQILEPILSRKWCCRSTTCTFSVWSWFAWLVHRIGWRSGPCRAHGAGCLVLFVMRHRQATLVAMRRT